MLQLNGHPQRSEGLTPRSEWRRASQMPKAGKCTFLGGRRTYYYYYYFIKINGKGPKPLTLHNKNVVKSQIVCNAI